jgi:hypothetical protein
MVGTNKVLVENLKIVKIIFPSKKLLYKIQTKKEKY